MNKTNQIRQRAYQIWQASGCPEGQADDHWTQAEAELAGTVHHPPTGQSGRPSGAVRSNAAAIDTDTADAVRVVGPYEMRDPPRQWSDADELSDESFPASDPPGTY